MRDVKHFSHVLHDHFERFVELNHAIKLLTLCQPLRVLFVESVIKLAHLLLKFRVRIYPIFLVILGDSGRIIAHLHEIFEVDRLPPRHDMVVHGQVPIFEGIAGPYEVRVQDLPFGGEVSFVILHLLCRLLQR